MRRLGAADAASAVAVGPEILVWRTVEFNVCKASLDDNLAPIGIKKESELTKLSATFVGLAAFATTSFAITNIKAVDWGLTPPDGSADVRVVPAETDLSNPLANVTYLGTIWGTRPGILQFDIKRDYDPDYQRTYVLCVELEQGNENALYGYKSLQGYAGYLASKIGDIVANPDPGHVKSAALALTTWELDYDGYDPATDTVNLANLNLSAGKLQYLQTGESLADFNAITAQANQDIAELQALDPKTVASWGNYQYFTNDGAQDYIASLPGPMAVLPFLLGAAIGLRRRLAR